MFRCHATVSIFLVVHVGLYIETRQRSWGSPIYLPYTNTLGGILFIMQSMLKAGSEYYLY